MVKSAKKTMVKVDKWDKVFDEVDPMILLSGALGAIATRGGIVPPFTQLMMAIGSGEAAEQIKNAWLDIAKLGSPGLFLGGEMVDYWTSVYNLLTGKNPDGSDSSSTEKAQTVAQSAVMASGAFEYMLLMTFAKNPEMQKAAYNAISTGAAGAGAALKAIL